MKRLFSVMPALTGAALSLLSLSCPHRFFSSSDDGLKYEYRIDSGSEGYYVLSKAYSSSVYELSIKSVYDDGLNGSHPVKVVGSDSFFDWKWLRKVKIPSSVTKIEQGAFYELYNLKSVEYADPCNVEEIESFVFSCCSTLENLTIPPKVKRIEEQTFKYCDGAKKVTFMESDSGSELEAIGDEAFKGCIKLSSITIPDSLVKIGKNAFEDCSALAAFTVSGGSRLEIIQDGAFAGCSSLATADIPKSVKFIGEKAFSGRGKSLKIRFGGSLEEWEAIAKDSLWDGGSENEISFEYNCEF